MIIKILGIILIIFGGFWIFSRLLNQPKMFQIIREKIREGGLIFGIKRYLVGELFGLGLGIGIVGVGFYLINPNFLSFFVWGAGILLSIVFLWGGFKLNALPHALIFLFGIGGFLLWGLSGLVGGLVIGWIATMLIGLLTIPIGKIFDIGRIKKEYRMAIAKDFFLENKEKILALEKFKSRKEDEIIKIFSKNINQICEETSRLLTPKQLHKYDIDLVVFEDNFIEGGKNWIKKLKDTDERNLMLKYVNFCRDIIYATYYGPYATEGPRRNITLEDLNNEDDSEQQVLPMQDTGSKNFFVKRVKKYQVITFAFGFLLLNQLTIILATYFADKDLFLERFGLNIWFWAIGIPVIYFLQWLLVVWVASKFTKEILKQKFLRHPIATIILFVLYITDLPYRLSEYWGGNIASIFEVIVYYAFISFLWWLLICWISDKIFKKQRFQWNWYKKIIDKIFIIIPPIYKFILGLIVALFIFLILLLLITMVFHYSGSDLKNLFNY